jgi:hypothetical protein
MMTFWFVGGTPTGNHVVGSFQSPFPFDVETCPIAGFAKIFKKNKAMGRSFFIAGLLLQIIV